ncbi:formylglycine-generating enzyme family protein [uncultured Nocardioides sp.]|uniref:formylglycine-generating enzyme family protein n=1 Tax=uncultured Nocardioides sp. TaxID=198441 RepID=UPI002631660C|nr:formylglycine-generating enzyme family protein [uncultured Nocardioides sp.]
MSEPSPCCAGDVTGSVPAPDPALDADPGHDPRPLPERAAPQRRGLLPIAGGSFTMGDHFDEGYAGDGELPLHTVELSPYLIAPTPVTNAQFATFVKATGWVTDAEDLGVSAVFHLAYAGERRHVLHQVAATPWWLAVRGADWRHPEGPGSDVSKRQNHPVVHVSWRDAQAYCAWSGTVLPSEAQWEHAARGGLDGARYPWGDELTPRGRWRMNIWQGTFPTANTLDDGHLTTAPVKAFAANGHGLHQTSGNVWEWCADWFSPTYYSDSPTADPTGPDGPGDGPELRVMRGGSYLCHASYCHRYRVAARSSNGPDAASANIGFRVANPA